MRNKRKELNEILQKEKIMWRQWARVRWIKEGNKNTTYFRKIANNRRRQNHINSIKIGTTEKAIQNHIDKH